MFTNWIHWRKYVLRSCGTRLSDLDKATQFECEAHWCHQCHMTPLLACPGREPVWAREGEVAVHIGETHGLPRIGIPDGTVIWRTYSRIKSPEKWTVQLYQPTKGNLQPVTVPIYLIYTGILFTYEPMNYLWTTWTRGMAHYLNIIDCNMGSTIFSCIWQVSRYMVIW